MKLKGKEKLVGDTMPDSDIVQVGENETCWRYHESLAKNDIFVGGIANIRQRANESLHLTAIPLALHSGRCGNYQTLINDALKEYIQAHDKSLEHTLRMVIRDELKKAV